MLMEFAFFTFLMENKGSIALQKFLGIYLWYYADMWCSQTLRIPQLSLFSDKSILYDSILPWRKAKHFYYSWAHFNNTIPNQLILFVFPSQHMHWACNMWRTLAVSKVKLEKNQCTNGSPSKHLTVTGSKLSWFS